MKYPEYWRMVAKLCDFAFQAIVDVNTGACHGVEALLRGQEKAGYTSIKEVFEAAYQAGMLNSFELALREKLLHRFRRIQGPAALQLFINIDNRVMEMADYDPAVTGELIHRFGLRPDRICFELSEQHAFKSFDRTKQILAAYRQMGSRIAVDDYGTGFAGLELLYHSEPDFIKLDRFFVSGLDNDRKKRLFVAGMVQLAHTLGSRVIAEGSVRTDVSNDGHSVQTTRDNTIMVPRSEGVETIQELRVCRELGCDLVQGWIIQKPVLDAGELKAAYPVDCLQLELQLASA